MYAISAWKSRAVPTLYVRAQSPLTSCGLLHPKQLLLFSLTCHGREIIHLSSNYLAAVIALRLTSTCRQIGTAGSVDGTRLRI